MENQFSEVYRKLPTVKLLEIIENPGDYQELAVETAKLELATRDDITASETEWQQNKSVLQTTSAEAEVKLLQKTSKVKELFDSTNYANATRPEKPILVICILLLALFFFKTFKYFDFIISSLSNMDRWGFSMYLFIVDLIFVPIAIYYAWRMSKLGWTMLVTYFIFCMLKDFMDVFWCYTYLGSGDIFDLILTLVFSFTLPSLIFHSILLYYILRQDIKGLFGKPIELEDDISDALVH